MEADAEVSAVDRPHSPTALHSEGLIGLWREHAKENRLIV
jgi:hypothetical protein